MESSNMRNVIIEVDYQGLMIKYLLASQQGNRGLAQ